MENTYNCIVLLQKPIILVIVSVVNAVGLHRLRYKKIWLTRVNADIIREYSTGNYGSRYNKYAQKRQSESL